MSEISIVPTIIYETILNVRARHPERPALIGVAGAQGSGKTTACQLLEAANRSRFAHFSLDDLYLSRAEREQRAASYCEIWVEHPPPWEKHITRPEREKIAQSAFRLLATRGPPGTHDLGLANGVIARLFQGLPTRLPRFDKIRDEHFPETDWPVFDAGAPEAILIDGWCLGAKPPEESPPMNAVEQEDVLGWWRAAVANDLRGYAAFFSRLDAIIYLQAPNWDVVRRWRGQQEAALHGRPLTADEEAWVDRFVMHYERITRSMMAGAHMPGTVVRLDEDRNVLGVETK